MQKTVEPSTRFRTIVYYGRLVLLSMGCDYIDPKYRMNIITYLVTFCIIFFFSCSLLTMVNFLTTDWTVIPEVLCTMNSGIQGTTKLCSSVYFSAQYCALYQQLDNIYMEYEKLGPKYEKVLHDSCVRTQKYVKTVGVIYTICISTMILFPLVFLVFNGNHYVILHFHVPGINIETPFGYGFTLFMHSAVCLCGGIGLYSSDFFFLTFLTHAGLFYDIFALKVQQLNEMVEENAKDSQVQDALNDIIQWHQFYQRFNAQCNASYFWNVTVLVASSAGSVVMTLFIILTKDWPAAYTYLVLAFNALYVYCIVGTRIEICNDKFCDEIYNINWYTLKPPQQKMVRLMLMQSQSPQSINIAGVLPLSVSTALRITRTIYSIFMMMVQFLT